MKYPMCALVALAALPPGLCPAHADSDLTYGRDIQGSRLVAPRRNAACLSGEATEEASALKKRLQEMDALRTGANTPFQEIEKQARDLLGQYTLPDDRAKIYFELAHIYAQSGIRLHPERVIRYGRLALASERDPVRRGVLYSYLGSAAEIDPTQLTFAGQRAQAAVVWLQGYRELLPLHLPVVAPELPVVEKLDVDALDPSQLASARLKHEAQMKARQEAERLQQLVAHRDIFVRQLKETYAREPRADAELRSLVRRELGDKQAADTLLSQILPK